MDLFVQNFFILLNKDIVETPENIQDVLQFVGSELNNVYEEQFYLQDLGVSFEYSDSLDCLSRKELLTYLVEWRKEHKRPTLF